MNIFKIYDEYIFKYTMNIPLLRDDGDAWRPDLVILGRIRRGFT